MVLSVISITNVYDANAKILPSSRADLTLSVGIEEKEIAHKDGSFTYERKFATEGNILLLYNDVGKVYRIFDKVIVPAIYNFVQKHETQLADKTIDQIRIEYYVPSNTLSVSMMGTEIYEKIQINSLASTDKPKIVTHITMRIPVSAGEDGPGNYRNLSYDILPNASVRVAYLTAQMLETLEKHKEKIVADVTHDDQGAEIGKILYGISSVMFDDMSRTTVSYRDEGHGYIVRMITEYDGGVQLVIPLPPSTSSFYQPVFLDVTRPVLFAKPADESIIIASAVALFGDIPEISLTYPDGKIISLLSTKIDSDRKSDYKLVELRCRLNASDPEGIYKVFIKAEADKVVPQNSGTHVTKVNEPRVPDCSKLASVQEKIPSSEFPVDIGLTDKNGKTVEADGSIHIADEMHSNVSFVIPKQEYMLKMHIRDSPDTKIFSMYYIVKISEYESGYTSQIKWQEVTVDPSMRSQEFEIPLQFEEGVYKIEVFLWHDLDNPKIVISRPSVSNSIVNAITIETTDKRYQGESNNTLLNSRGRISDDGLRQVSISDVIIEPHGRVGGNWGGFEFQDEFSLVVRSEQAVYGDIVYYGGIPREWIIVKQALSREFRIDVQIPEEQSIFNYKWGIYLLNLNAEPVRARITTIITDQAHQLKAGKSQSSISLMATPESVSLNDMITLEGKIDPPHSAKVSVVMTTLSLGDEVIKLTTNSSATGEYKILFKANTVGRWDARANWEGDEDHLGAVSGLIFNVETM